MIDSIFKILGAGIQLLSDKERTKYQDTYLRLKKEWNDEMDQPDDYRSQLSLDRIERELRDLGDSFAYSVSGKNPTP